MSNLYKNYLEKVPELVKIYPILREVGQERLRQNELFGEQNHDFETWYTILGEEFGEVGKALQDIRFRGAGTENLREELLQVAAVAVAIVECLDRNKCGAV